MNTEIKYFTPAEAKRTLPLVKKIVADILSTAKEIKLLAEDFDGDIEKNPDFIKLYNDIKSFLKELEEIGCYYKDPNFSIGLVDFPSIIDNREVYLCWRSDEDDILYYHEIDAGYLGRKLIPPQYFSE
ncbi:MAG: DUF2203 domain-containing protein [Ignavibacterium sp.]|nr:DUF2203 domain-containing protein [Ignavibacterium sp.]MDW8375354.1 DUF2203 domain-containing protein [Ignavibacteriales bacterium]